MWLVLAINVAWISMAGGCASIFGARLAVTLLAVAVFQAPGWPCADRSAT